jgi:hypothetical protein
MSNHEKTAVSPCQTIETPPLAGKITSPFGELANQHHDKSFFRAHHIHK